MINALPFALRFSLLCWYSALVVHGHPWFAMPLLVLFALGWGVGKAPPIFPVTAKHPQITAFSSVKNNQAEHQEKEK